MFTQKFVHTKINTYSNKNECIKILMHIKSFCLYVCNKDLRHRLGF